MSSSSLRHNHYRSYSPWPSLCSLQLAVLAKTSSRVWICVDVQVKVKYNLQQTSPFYVKLKQIKRCLLSPLVISTESSSKQEKQPSVLTQQVTLKL